MNYKTNLYPMQSRTPLYVGSPGALLIACSLVLITSNGLTNNAADEPATHPARNEHQNTAVIELKKIINIKMKKIINISIII